MKERVPMYNILIVEDNEDLLKLFCLTLKQSGYNVFSATDGKEALSLFSKVVIDCVVADIMMPNMDGYELTEELRYLNPDLPVMLVTALDDYDSIKKGFASGIDDYMIKPINVKEMALRVQALLRRAKIKADKSITVGNTVMDYETMTVTHSGKPIELTLKEFHLLFKLLYNVGKIFTRQQLMDDIWGLSESDDHTINTHINRLREKFKDVPDFEIVTIRGLGYKAVKL